MELWNRRILLAALVKALFLWVGMYPDSKFDLRRNAHNFTGIGSNIKEGVTPRRSHLKQLSLMLRWIRNAGSVV
jgi:hypothetical protein